MTQISIFQGWENFGSFTLVMLITVVTSLGKILASLCSESQNNNIFPQSDNRYFLHSVKNTAQFILFGCFISHLPIAIICACLVCGFGRAPWNLFIEIAVTWWLSDSFGILIFTPLIVAWQKQVFNFIKCIKKQWLNTLVTVFLVFIINQSIINTSYDIQFLYIPLVVWVVFKFEELGASLVVLVITINLMLATIAQTTSFAMESTRDSLLLLQSFIACISMTTLLLGAVLSENNYRKQELIKLNKDLSAKNKLLEELNRQKDLQSEAKEKILTEYNRLLQKQLSLVKAKEKAENLTKRKSLFFASLSNDFLNPINALVKITESLANTQLNDQQREYTQIIQQTISTLLKAVNDIFNFSSIEIGDFELQEDKLSIKDILQSINILFSKQSQEKEVNISYSIQKELPNFIGDASRIRQVLFNILGSSFYNQNSSVFIYIKEANLLNKNKGLDNSKTLLLFTIKSTIHDQNEVREDGEAIQYDGETALCDRTENDKIIDTYDIFNTFETTTEFPENNRELELFIAQKLINAMGGTIWIENDGKIKGNPPAQWSLPSPSSPTSIIYFTLQLCPISSEENKSTSSHIFKELSPLNILIAEDNRINQKIMLYHLKQLGYEGEFVADGAALLEQVKQKKI